jgi:hypothetical protein
MVTPDYLPGVLLIELVVEDALMLFDNHSSHSFIRISPCYYIPYGRLGMYTIPLARKHQTLRSCKARLDKQTNNINHTKYLKRKYAQSYAYKPNA